MVLFPVKINIRFRYAPLVYIKYSALFNISKLLECDLLEITVASVTETILWDCRRQFRVRAWKPSPKSSSPSELLALRSSASENWSFSFPITFCLGFDWNELEPLPSFACILLTSSV